MVLEARRGRLTEQETARFLRSISHSGSVLIECLM